MSDATQDVESPVMPDAAVIGSKDGLGIVELRDANRRANQAIGDIANECAKYVAEAARYREALQRIATSHPINDEPLATAHSLRAHKALRPDCKCERCMPKIS